MTEARNRNLTTRATYALRQRILNGGLPGGARLFEVALSEELRISRTPVREAMSRLAEEGLLERARGGGFQVRGFSRRDVIDAIELRGVLEGTAARLAAERGVAGEKLVQINDVLARLDAGFGLADGSANFDLYSELNALFHDLLAGLCASPVILRELERVKSLPFASPSAFVLGQPDTAGAHRSLVVAQAQHHAIVQAIEACEGARAEALTREHARIARGNLEGALIEEARAGEGLPGMALITR